MYKLILILLFTLSLLASDGINKSNQEIPQNLIEKIRTIYYTGVEDEDYIDSLQTIITNNFSDKQKDYPALILAYKAGAEALKSKHAFWPFNKMSYLNDSMELFSSAIQKAPHNLEIRFMRYSILHYVPGILGYSEELKEDQNIILDLLAKNQNENINTELKNGIISFMIESERLSKNEIASLTNIQVSLKK